MARSRKRTADIEDKRLLRAMIRKTLLSSREQPEEFVEVVVWEMSTCRSFTIKPTRVLKLKKRLAWRKDKSR